MRAICHHQGLWAILHNVTRPTLHFRSVLCYQGSQSKVNVLYDYLTRTSIYVTLACLLMQMKILFAQSPKRPSMLIEMFIVGSVADIGAHEPLASECMNQ